MLVEDMILNYFKKYQDEDSVIYGTLTDEEVSYIERELNVKLPDSYKWYIKQFGTGGILGIWIEGGSPGEIEESTVIETTRTFQEQGLPDGYVVIVNHGPYMMVLDTNQMKDGECPVLNWSPYEDNTIYAKDHFFEYLLCEIIEGIDSFAE